LKLYLEQLIYALNDSDIERLAKMDLRKSKMKYYLDILVENRKQGIPSNQSIMDKLDLDLNSFAKLKSLLLARSLKELVPNGGIDLLNFLSRYRLQEIFMREVDYLIEEAEKNPKVSADAKAIIYLHGVRGYIRLPYSFFDEQEMQRYVNGFLINYNQPDLHELENLIRLNKIFILIVKSFYAMDSTPDNYAAFSEEIKIIADKYLGMSFNRVKYFAEAIKLILDFYYKARWPELQEGFERLVYLCTELKNPHAQDEIFALRFYVGYNQIMMGNFSKANEILDQLKNDNKETFHFYPKVVFRFAMSLLIDGKNEECKHLLDTYMRKDILIYDPDATIMSCLAHTAYYLLENETDAAAKYIDLYNSINNIKGFMSFKLGMKLFEVIYYFQKGEDNFAAMLLKKTVRYLKDKSATMSGQNNSMLNKALLDLLNKFIDGKTDLNGFEVQINNIFKGNQTIVNKLFINAIKWRSNKK
jgi:hypothetical protein